jgi:hypothetical protein
LALMGIDLFTDPALRQKAREELNQVRGKDFVYKPIIGDARPAVE